MHTTTPHNIESTQNTNNTDTNYLTVTEESNIAIHTGLKRTYLLGKKIKLALYKIIKYIPKVILGNCKRNAKE